MLQLFENEQFWLDSKQSSADLHLILCVFTITVHINNLLQQKFTFWIHINIKDVACVSQRYILSRTF